MVMEGRPIASWEVYNILASLPNICTTSSTSQQTIRPTDSVVWFCWYYYVVPKMTYSGLNKSAFQFPLFLPRCHAIGQGYSIRNVVADIVGLGTRKIKQGARCGNKAHNRKEKEAREEKNIASSQVFVVLCNRKFLKTKLQKSLLNKKNTNFHTRND